MGLQQKRKQHILILIIIVFIFTMVTGCASSGKSRRGKLSGAMGKASSPNLNKDRSSRSSSSDNSKFIKFLSAAINSEDSTYENNNSAKSRVRKSSSVTYAKDVFWGVAIDSADFMNKEDFHNMTVLNIIFGAYGTDYSRVEISGGLGDTQIKRTSPLNDSMKDHIQVLTAGMNMKRFLTPKHTFFGAYLSGGFNYNRIFWRYENPIQPDGENVTIHRDDLEGIDFYLGAGINLIQIQPNRQYNRKGFQLGIEALPTFTVWGNQTYEGFENDVFGSFRSVKLRVVSTFFF